MFKKPRYYRFVKKAESEEQEKLKEAPPSDIFGHTVSPDQRVFITDEPYEGFRNVQQKPDSQKPSGLWYACGNAWIDWVRSEMPDRFKTASYLYEVIPTDKVVKIDSLQKFGILQRRFGYNKEGLPLNLIDWARVQEAVAGIEICPYPLPKETVTDPMFGNMELEQPGLDDLWYSMWEVASGVIWDERGIQDIKLLANA